MLKVWHPILNFFCWYLNLVWPTTPNDIHKRPGVSKIVLKKSVEIDLMTRDNRLGSGACDSAGPVYLASLGVEAKAV